MPTIHEIEPELLSRTPRRIERRNDASNPFKGAGMGCIQIFMLPFIAIGLLLSAILLHRILIPYAGVNVPAAITSRETHSDDDGQTYSANFTYTYGGVSYAGSSKVDPAVYDTLETGQRAQVEILPILPDRWPRLSNPSGKYQLGSIGFLVGFTLFWNGIVALFVWAIFVWPVIVKHIYRNGMPAVATITDKKTLSGEDSTTYTIKYEFTPADIHGRLGTVVKGQQPVTQAAWKEVYAGEDYTILYLPNRPRMNVLYQYGGYRVAG